MSCTGRGHDITLQYITVQYMTSHYSTLHYSTVQCTDIILKQINKIKNLNIFFFHFSFFSVVSRYVSPLCFPIVVPIALPRRWVEVLEPTVEKNDDLGLVPIFKQHISKKICDFPFFLLRFMYSHLKQLNKNVNIRLYVFHF